MLVMCDCDEIKMSLFLYQVWRNVKNAQQVMNGCRQNKNITIIHGTPVLQLTSGEDKRLNTSSINTFLTQIRVYNPQWRSSCGSLWCFISCLVSQSDTWSVPFGTGPGSTANFVQEPNITNVYSIQISSSHSTLCIWAEITCFCCVE